MMPVRERCTQKSKYRIQEGELIPGIIMTYSNGFTGKALFRKKRDLASACIFPEILLRFRGDILWYILCLEEGPAFPYFFHIEIVSVLILFIYDLKQD